jgi:prevent-host-death family protein
VKASKIRPITELKNRTKELVSEVAEGGQSVVITQNGKPRVVMMPAAEHDRLHDTLAMLKLLAQSQQSVTRTGTLLTSTEVRARVKQALVRARKR